MRTVAAKARVGLHRPRFEYDSFALLSKDEARAAYNKLVQACVDFMREMGISDQVFSDMLRVPSQEIRFASEAYLERCALSGKDPAWQEWQRARDIQQNGEAEVKAADRAQQCFDSGKDFSECLNQFKKELRDIEAKKQKVIHN